MVPAGEPTEQALTALLARLQAGDVMIDGGNSNYKDSMRRAELALAHGVAFLDAGTSGGVWGREVGYCLMVGGARDAFARVEPVLKSLAPADGYLYTVGSGSGAPRVRGACGEGGRRPAAVCPQPTPSLRAMTIFSALRAAR